MKKSLYIMLLVSAMSIFISIELSARPKKSTQASKEQPKKSAQPTTAAIATGELTSDETAKIKNVRADANQLIRDFNATSINKTYGGLRYPKGDKWSFWERIGKLQHAMDETLSTGQKVRDLLPNLAKNINIVEDKVDSIEKMTDAVKKYGGYQGRRK